jgi:two-component system response regulator HydG
MSVVKSLSEFKFFKSFRLPIVSGDDVHFSVEKEDPFTERGEFIKDAQLVDASITGLGFKTTEKVALEEEVKISFSYKRLRFDVTGRVVRAISGHSSDPKLIYGIEIEDNEDRENMSRFLGQLISSFSHDRLRDCVKNLALAERYADMDEGFEMFSLLLSLFKDVTQFGHKEGFIDSMLVEVTRLINAQKAMVFLINTETNELEAHSATGIDKSILKFDYRKGVAGTVFTTGVSLNIDAKHERIKSFEKLDKKTGIETKSVICSPVYNREDKIIGVIQILNKKNQDRFSEEDEKTMRMLSLVFSCFFSQYNPMSEKSLVRRFSAPNARQIIYIGRSESTTNLRKMILKLKDQTSPLLICGEKGTGKSLYANILHAEGSRGVQDFEAIHCVGYPENEWNDKLFGTGDSVGSLQKCNGGTICFEEIWAMPRSVQHNLVKIMKDGKLNPNDQIKLDMRFIFTSSVELEDSFSKAKLVPELFEMIHTYRVNLEPLRNRKRDIGEMIDFFIAKECKDQGFFTQGSL